MIQSNFMEKLLDGVEVEWKTLGEVVKTVTAPTKVKKDEYKISGKLPIIDQGIEFIAGYTDEDYIPVKEDEYIVFGDHSEHIKYVNFDFDCRDCTVWKVIFRTNVGEQIIFQKKYGEDLAKTIYKYLEGLL